LKLIPYAIDGASYHDKQKEKPPTSNSKKESSKNCLPVRNMPFSCSLLNVQLH